MKVSYCDGCKTPVSQAKAKPYRVFVYDPTENTQIASESFDFCDACREAFLQRLKQRLPPPDNPA